MNSKVLIIVLLVVVLAGGGVVAFMMLGNSSAPVGDVITEFPLTEKMTTNTTDGDKMVQVAIVLTFTNAGDQATVTANMTAKQYILRDVINYALRGKTTDELLDANTTQPLKDEILRALNEELAVDYITDIYFNDFVLT